MSRYPLRIAGWIATLAVVVGGQRLVAQSSATDPSARPNILFIAIDDLKPTLGCYGDEVAITPTIDRIASEGTVFLNCYCQWPVCGPSRASLMTSLRPEANGVMDLKTDMRAKDPNVLTLPQHFKNNGYATAGCGKIYDPRCVDSKHTNDVPSWSLPYTTVRYQNVQYNDYKLVTMAPEVDDADLADGQITQCGIKLLRKLSQSREPFFLAMGFKKPHLPFITPKKYWDLYPRHRFSLAAHRGGIDEASGYTLHDSPEFRGYDGVPNKGIISDELQRECIHGYYACASFIDAQVNLLVRELERLGLAQDTIIAVWGDHGFHLGDHNMWGKHSTLEHATRSPLIIRSLKGKAIHETDAPVEFTDIFPTLCDLAGIPIPDELNGRSLVPLITEKKSAIRRRAMTVFKSRGSIGYSYRTRRYRYTRWINKSGKTVATELYDYEADPDETVNLADYSRYDSVKQAIERSMQLEAQGCDRLLTAK